MEKLGVTDAQKELYSIGGGGYIRKSDSKALSDLVIRLDAEMKTAMEDKQFMTDAIRYELANHEYCITHDPTQTIELLDIDMTNPTHVECFNIARRQYLSSLQE